MTAAMAADGRTNDHHKTHSHTRKRTYIHIHACTQEVKLPHAAQTHEVCFEPVTNCVYVTQMSNSVLVKIPVGADGLLMDDQVGGG